MKAQWNIHDKEASIASSVATKLADFKEHVQRLSQVFDDLEYFYSRRCVLSMKVQQKMRRQRILSDFASHLVDSLQHNDLPGNHVLSRKGDQIYRYNEKNNTRSNKKRQAKKREKRKKQARQGKPPPRKKNKTLQDQGPITHTQQVPLTSTQQISSPTCVVFYGSATFKSSMKGNRSVPSQALVRHLASRITVLGVNEYLTSQVCSACSYYPLWHRKDLPWFRSRKVAYCKNSHCNLCWNRDVNASRNMRQIGEYWLQYTQRHPYYTRQRKKEEQPVIQVLN